MTKHAKIKGKSKKSKEGSNVNIKAKDKILCVILGENTFSNFIWIDGNKQRFTYRDNTYFLVKNDGYVTHNRILVYVYLEGISLPISHRYVKRKDVDREIKTEGGKTKKITVSIIDGLKFDSKVIDRLLNSGLAEIFTHIREDKLFYLMFIMLIISIMLNIISIGVSYFYGQ